MTEQVKEIASRGKVETMTAGAAQQENKEQKQEGVGADGLPIQQKKIEPEQKQPPAPPEFTEEQLQSFFEAKGIKYEGLDKLKEKVDYVIPEHKAEETPEQKEAHAKAEEKRILDYYIANGGTAETYVAVKSLLASDLTEVSIAEIRKEMKEAGFDEDETNAVLKERYYQVKTDEIDTVVDKLEQGVDEDDTAYEARKVAYKASLEKKIAYGNKKIEARKATIKTKAENFISGLKEAIKAEDLQKEEEVQTVSKVDAALKELPRKMTLQLGKVNDQDISPVEYEVSEESIAKVSAILKDPAQRKQFLNNQDGSLNVSKIAELMVRNEQLENIAKVALLEGGTREVEKLRKIFPSNPQALGVGGASGASKAASGNVTQRGTVKRVRA